MTLNLRKTAVVSEAARGRVDTALDILAQAQAEVAAMGIHDAPRPDEAPPTLGDLDLEAIDNRGLGALYLKYVAYAAFLSPKIAATTAAYKVSAANMKRVAANISTELVAREVPKAEIRALIQEHPLYVEQELDHLKLYATMVILESHYKSYGQMAKALSRIVELRKLEFEETLRSAGINNHKRPPAGRPGNFSRPR